MKNRFLFGMLLVLALAGPAVLADPFEYEPQVTLYGSYPYSGFGREVIITDINNDLSPDLLISDSDYNDDGGRIMFFLDVNDFPAGMFEITENPPDISIVGQYEDGIGNEVTTCDFNGDGISDIVFNREYWGGRDEYLFVFYGSDHWESGTVITDLEGEADVVIIPNEENEDRFRWPFICGDINGDEYADLLAGEKPVVIPGGDYSSGTWIDLEVDPPIVRFTNFTTYTRFLADVNGDGRNDFLFSENDIVGMIRIWFGFDDYSNPIVIDPDLTPPDVTEEGPYLFAGYHLVDVGDWSGDGVADMLLCQSYPIGEEDYYIYRLNPGEAGMQPGHEFSYLFAVMTENFPLRFADMNGDDQLDLALQAREFYWDRNAFPQTGNWELWDYEPQGIFQGAETMVGDVLAGNLDNDGEQDAIFYNASFNQVDLYFTSPRPDDDDDTGPDDDDNDTGPDDDDDNDTGPDDDDNDTGPDDDDDTGPDDDDNDDNNDDDDDGCCG